MWWVSSYKQFDYTNKNSKMAWYKQTLSEFFKFSVHLRGVELWTNEISQWAGLLNTMLQSRNPRNGQYAEKSIYMWNRHSTLDKYVYTQFYRFPKRELGCQLSPFACLKLEKTKIKEKGVQRWKNERWHFRSGFTSGTPQCSLHVGTQQGLMRPLGATHEYLG